jgi:RNA polymerase sigma factor for flagellar operon FliA
MEKAQPIGSPGAMDDEMRNRILLEQMPQVRLVARQIYERLPKHVPLEDLVHAGVLGLMDALAKYDTTRQVQFRTYAKFRIRGAILDSLRELDWSPRELRQKARQVQAAAAQIGHELGRSASEQEIAAELGWTLASFQQLLGELEGLDLGSLQAWEGSGEHGEELSEHLPGDPEESPYCLTMKSEQRQMLVEAMAELSEREQQVLSLYYFEERTMKEAGAALGVGESRISQIHSLALLRLRVHLQALLEGRKISPLMAERAARSALDGSLKEM